MVLIAFFAGLISFLSPCVLPLIPSYLSFITGVSVTELATPSAASRVRLRVSLHASLFIIGFSLVFILLGASATALGRILLSYQLLLRRLGGLLVLGLGATLAGLLNIPFLSRERRLSLSRHPTGLLGSVAIGAVFAFGWSPCVGPILGSILVLAGTSERLSEGLVLLVAYSLGLGIPFFIAALATSYFLSTVKILQKYLVVVERVSGVLLMGIGLLLLTGLFSWFTVSLNRWLGPMVQFLSFWERRMFGGNLP